MVGNNIIVTYTINGKSIEDIIEINEKALSVHSSAGWKYESGKAVSGEVKAFIHKNNTSTLRVDKNLSKANYVRLDFAGGDTYYCRVNAVNKSTLLLTDDPGFTLDKNGNVQFYTFPQHHYKGPLRYTVFTF
jgi:hypothetical protein